MPNAQKFDEFKEGFPMKIEKILQEKELTLSFEIFPPKADSPVDVIYTTLAGLSKLNPDFISVTYGAGGSNKGRALEIAALVKNTYGVEPLAHLTCVGASREETADQIRKMSEAGIENILALRGDVPKDMDPEHAFTAIPHASDLIAQIRKTAPDCCIGAAAYPEVHAESDSRAQDLCYLKKKADEGAAFFITQLFFDNDAYFRLCDYLEALNVKAPVVAGIMPMLNPEQILRMATLCGCSIPAGISHLIARYKNRPDDFRKAGMEYAERQIDALVRGGARGIHLYSMNKAEEITEIVRACGLR